MCPLPQLLREESVALSLALRNLLNPGDTQQRFPHVVCKHGAAAVEDAQREREQLGQTVTSPSPGPLLKRGPASHGRLVCVFHVGCRAEGNAVGM